MKRFALAKLIRTDSKKLFVYDGLTNKIISVDCVEWASKKNLSMLSKKIFTELFQAGLLHKEQRKPSCWTVSFDEYKNFLEDSVPEIILQITRGCNLACSYCVYSGKYPHVRTAATDDMSPEIIRRSIDFYAAHSGKVPVKNISFYGGEPLLRFREIKNAVTYANALLKGKLINFSMSTNGTLLGKGVFDWMRENPNVKITVTLNGTFQDKYRRTLEGMGTLKTVLKNLTLLRDSYPEIWKNRIAFIANYISLTEVSEILKFYEQLGITEQPIFLTGIRRDLANEEIQQLLDTNVHKESLARKALRREFYENPDGLIKNLFRNELEILNERKIFSADEEMQIASCMPFTVKLFVRTDGKFNMCERTSDSLILGDLESGFDYRALAETLIETEQIINRNCRDCWAQRICMICFQNMTNANGAMRKKFPTDVCRYMRRNLYNLLKVYCEFCS